MVVRFFPVARIQCATRAAFAARRQDRLCRRVPGARARTTTALPSSASARGQHVVGYSRYFENVKSCAFCGTWQLKHCFTGSVAIGFVESPPAHAWNPQPPVDAYFFEALTMRVMAVRAAPSR